MTNQVPTIAAIIIEDRSGLMKFLYFVAMKILSFLNQIFDIEYIVRFINVIIRYTLIDI